MAKRTKVIREKVRNLSEQEAKSLLAQLIELTSDSSFGDPSFPKTDDVYECFRKIQKSLLLNTYGIN